MTKPAWQAVLRFSDNRISQSKVRRYYEHYRREHGLPERCDNATCVFHTETLIWNGERLKPILDHVNGVRGDNRPENLQLLCGNCDSQRFTRGGGNKGRVLMSSGGFAIARRDGKHDYTLVADTGLFGLSGGATASADIVTALPKTDAAAETLT